MEPFVKVAISRLPDRGHAIEELSRTSENVRSLCVDLADAEAAAVRWERSSSPLRAERGAEYRELANDLAAELSAALDRHPRGDP